MEILIKSTMHDGSQLDTVDHADLIALQAHLINAIALIDEIKEYVPLDVLEKRQIERRIDDLRIIQP
jgi:hypothetical protein